MTSRPRIVLTLALPDTEARRSARARYVAALERAGAEVIAVDADGAVPDELDGLCVSGGEDMDPRRYGEPDRGCETVSPERDALELALVATALERDLPILGICRGFQVLNVAFGGSLVQHVDGHRPEHPDGVVSHVATPAAGSRLARATSASPQRVNSRHHQAVTADRLGHGLVATVQVGELIEAFESDRHRWVVGVQWHPERTAEVDPDAARIFGAFVRAAERVPAR